MNSQNSEHSFEGMMQFHFAQLVCHCCIVNCSETDQETVWPVHLQQTNTS